MTTHSGHPLAFVEVDVDRIDEQSHAIEAIYDARRTGVVVRGAFPPELVAAAVARLGADAGWTSPNRGMRGGEIRTIGDAATPTFTHLRGPSDELYHESAAQHAARTEAVFGDAEAPTRRVQWLLSRLFAGRPAAPPAFEEGLSWAPYNFRALDPGQQIYTHHDSHYGLSLYQRMDAALDRATLLSFFVTLQAPEGGGRLVVYGLWGNDPDVPMLPTRFIDTAAIEARFEKRALDLGAGDLVIFDAGRHVHRVTPIEGERPRLTFGGFLTLAKDRSRLAFWS
jgi:hypothetical protein